MIALTRSVSSLLFLIIISVSVFAARAVDILFPDVIPLRPYTGVFVTASLHNIPLSHLIDIQIPLLFMIMMISLLIVSIVFHIPLFQIVLAKKASLHPNTKHSAGRHRDYVSLRNISQVSQINVSVEMYAEEKRKAFEKKSKKKNIVIGDEILWQD